MAFWLLANWQTVIHTITTSEDLFKIIIILYRQESFNRCKNIYILVGVTHGWMLCYIGRWDICQNLLTTAFTRPWRKICARHLSWTGHGHDYDDCHAGDYNDHGDFDGHDITIVDFRLSMYMPCMYYIVKGWTGHLIFTVEEGFKRACWKHIYSAISYGIWHMMEAADICH